MESKRRVHSRRKHFPLWTKNLRIPHLKKQGHKVDLIKILQEEVLQEEEEEKVEAKVEVEVEMDHLEVVQVEEALVEAVQAEVAQLEEVQVEAAQVEAAQVEVAQAVLEVEDPAEEEDLAEEPQEEEEAQEEEEVQQEEEIVLTENQDGQLNKSKVEKEDDFVFFYCILFKISIHF